MAYVLRFVQRFDLAQQERFLALEREFARIEADGAWPRGRRMRALSGREPNHTLIWECEFATLTDIESALRRLEASPDHARLFAAQAPAMRDAYTEIYEVLDF